MLALCTVHCALDTGHYTWLGSLVALGGSAALIKVCKFFLFKNFALNKMRQIHAVHHQARNPTYLDYQEAPRARPYASTVANSSMASSHQARNCSPCAIPEARARYTPLRLVGRVWGSS